MCLCFKYHKFNDIIFKRICTLNHIYTVVIYENLDGTYELSINERGFYLKPTIFMDCDTDATDMNAINMTLDDVHSFCNAVHDSDLKNKRRRRLFNFIKKR